MVKKAYFFAFFVLTAPLASSAQPAPSPGSPAFYVVHRGDCLWSISRHLWADPLKWPLLFSANQGLIRNPNLIYPGQKFSVPSDLSAAALKKADRLAQSRAEPLMAGSGSEETGGAIAGNPAINPSSSGKTRASSPVHSSPAKTGMEKPESASRPLAATVPPEKTPSHGLFNRVLLLVVTLLVLVVGIFLWKRRSMGGAFEASQRPRPLSSFPQAGEPAATRPFPAEPSSPVTPVRPPAVEAKEEPKEWNATITSASIPDSPSPQTSSNQPAQASIAPPVPGQAPSSPEASSAPAAEPSSPVPQEGENKGADRNDPPSSSHSAA